MKKILLVLFLFSVIALGACQSPQTPSENTPNTPETGANIDDLNNELGQLEGELSDDELAALEEELGSEF